MKELIYKPLVSLSMFGFVVGLTFGAIMTEQNSGQAHAAGEQRIERFSDACARSATTGNQPSSCDNVTH